MNAQNKFLLEKIRIMTRQIENNLKKKTTEDKKEEENKKLIKQPAGKRINRVDNSTINWTNSLRSPW
tara:strand:+ start:291 stop:491 length:201 start_codon:yes stop_codon:yes gene_type:complete